MSDPVTLIVLVASGEASSPTSVAMAHAIRDALGGATVEVRETPRAPTDAEVLAAEATLQPDAVVELVWEDAAHRRVTLRVHMARPKRWLERSMAYAASDPASERGRTLGLAIAATLPEIAPSRATSQSAPTAPHQGDPSSLPSLDAPTPLPPPAMPPRSAPGLAQRGGADVRAPTVSRTPEPEPELMTPADRRAGRPRLEVQLVVSGATGLGGSANTAGGGGAAQWFFAPWLAARLGVAERSGDLNVAQATVFTFYGAAGISVQPWQATPARPLDLSIRVDYLAVRQSARHFDSDDPLAVTQARWLSGVDVFLDTGWVLSADVAVLAGLGVEDVLAPTYVEVRNARVATIPPLRVVAELGVRLRF